MTQPTNRLGEVLDGGRGHTRIDLNGECAMTFVNLGPVLNIWQTHGGLDLDPTGARALAARLNAWADSR